MKKYSFGINGYAERRVLRGGDGGVGRVLGAEGDVADSVAVDADAGDAAVDLEPGLHVEDGTLWREADNEHGPRGGVLGGGRIAGGGVR